MTEAENEFGIPPTRRMLHRTACAQAPGLRWRRSRLAAQRVGRGQRRLGVGLRQQQARAQHGAQLGDEGELLLGAEVHLERERDRDRDRDRDRELDLPCLREN